MVEEYHRRFRQFLENSMQVPDGRDGSELEAAILSYDTNIDQVESILSEVVSIPVGSDEEDFLQAYISTIESNMEWARQLDSTEVVPNKKNEYSMLLSLTRQLTADLETAVNEGNELEDIARRLQDAHLLTEVQYEEEQMMEAGRNLEGILERREKLNVLMNDLEALEQYVNSHEITASLQHRKKVIGLILENSGEASTDDPDVLRVSVPPWEKERFGKDVVEIRIENDGYLEDFLHSCMFMLELVDDEGSFSGDLDINLEIKKAEIPYARKVSKPPTDDRIDYSLPDELNPGGNIEVWMNAAFTRDTETTDGSFSSKSRMIVADHRIKGNKPALISILVHELMHATLEHKGSFTHLEIHEHCIRLLSSVIQIMESRGRENLSEEISIGDLRQSLVYAMASSTLFPDE